MRSLENEECGKRRVLKLRSVEKPEDLTIVRTKINKHSISFKKRCIIAFSMLNRTLFFKLKRRLAKR